MKKEVWDTIHEIGTDPRQPISPGYEDWQFKVYIATRKASTETTRWTIKRFYHTAYNAEPAMLPMDADSFMGGRGYWDWSQLEGMDTHDELIEKLENDVALGSAVGWSVFRDDDHGLSL